MQKLVGFKLIEMATGAEIRSWGGTWGQCPGIPNPLMLPNGDHVHAPAINTDYSGHMLTEWMMDEPPPIVPDSITRRQCALQLLADDVITAQEALNMTKTGTVPANIYAVFQAKLAPEQVIIAEIDFAATNYYRTNSRLSMIDMGEADIDQFFIKASKL